MSSTEDKATISSSDVAASVAEKEKTEENCEKKKVKKNDRKGREKEEKKKHKDSDKIKENENEKKGKSKKRGRSRERSNSSRSSTAGSHSSRSKKKRERNKHKSKTSKRKSKNSYRKSKRLKKSASVASSSRSSSRSCSRHSSRYSSKRLYSKSKKSRSTSKAVEITKLTLSKPATIVDIANQIKLKEKATYGISATQILQQKALSRIYVGSLDYFLAEEDIKSVFSSFGKIEAIDLPRENGRSKGFCFIDYKHPESASMAIQSMKSFVLKGRTLRVSRPSSVGSELLTLDSPAVVASCMNNLQAAALESAANLISKKDYDLDLDFRDEVLNKKNNLQNNDLISLLSKVGLSANQGAAAVASLMNNQSVTKSNQNSTSGGNNRQKDRRNRIYVGNVPLAITQDDIRKVFVVFGEIVSCQLMPHADVKGAHRGYGFIEFENENVAQLAIQGMNGFIIAGRSLKVNHATSFAPSNKLQIKPTTNNNNTSLCNITENMNNNSNYTNGLMQINGYAANTNLNNYLTMNDNINNSYINDMNLVNTMSLNSMQMQGGYNGAGTGANAIIPNLMNPNMIVSNAIDSTASTTAYSSVQQFYSPQQLNTRVLVMKNTINFNELDEQLQDEIKEECSKYGEVDKVIIKTDENKNVSVYIFFTTVEYAMKALPSLNSRWFAGRKILCEPVYESTLNI